MKERTLSRNQILARLCSPNIALIALAAMQLSASAAAINYGNFPGANVDYQQVTEDSNSGDNPPLFGAPTVTGDTIDFDPVGFSASAANGAVDQTDGNLKFIIDAHNNKAISSVSFAEAGDVSMLGIVPLNSIATFASVTTFINVDIDEVDGAPISVVQQNNIPMTIGPSGGTYTLGVDGLGGPNYAAGWSGSINININAILTANNIPFTRGATRVNINLDNTLNALSQAAGPNNSNTSVLIAKKNAAGGVTITAFVPEPSSGFLALAAGALAAVRRRRG